jgi:hypothetical protein
MTCSKSIHDRPIPFGDSVCCPGVRFFISLEVTCCFYILRIVSVTHIIVLLSEQDVKRRELLHERETRATRNHEVSLEREAGCRWNWLQTFMSLPETCMYTFQILKWTKAIKTGRTNVLDDTRGRSRLDHIDSRTLSLFTENGFHSVGTFAQELGISLSTVHNRLVSMLRLSLRHARWVPHLLPQQFKTQRVIASIETIIDNLS